jgi:hypothetical protein
MQEQAMADIRGQGAGDRGPDGVERPTPTGNGERPLPVAPIEPGSQAQAREVRLLGLLMPGVLRVVDIRALSDGPRRWLVTLCDAPELRGSEGLGEATMARGSLRAVLSFETDDLALMQQLRQKRLRLACDLLELQRTGPEAPGERWDIP